MLAQFGSALPFSSSLFLLFEGWRRIQLAYVAGILGRSGSGKRERKEIRCAGSGLVGGVAFVSPLILGVSSWRATSGFDGMSREKIIVIKKVDCLF